MSKTVQAKELKSLFQTRLRSFRNAKGLNQKELADRIGAKQPYVAALETGVRSPTLDTIAKLSEALGVPPSLFMAN